MTVLSAMKLIGPERYKLSFDHKSFTVACPKGSSKFSRRAGSKVPTFALARGHIKLFIVSESADSIIYSQRQDSYPRRRLE